MSAGPPVNRPRLFLASCVAMVTLALTFSIRSDILSEMGRTFDLSHRQQGLILAAVSWGYPVAILVAAPLVDAIGMGRLMGLGCVAHLAGLALTIASPAYGFPVLLAASFLIGVADGLVEAVINPLVATMYPRDKTGRISALHAAWPLGLIIGGLLCLALNRWVGWQGKMALVLVAAAGYGLLILGQRFPRTERAASGLPASVMFREAVRPGFLVLLVCMAFTAVTEGGPDQWIGSVMTDTTGIRGITFLIYTSVIMYVMRLYGGTLARLLSPFGLLAASCALAGTGLFWLSHAFSPLVALAACTVFAVGKTCLWTTLLGVTAERYPRGGSLLFALLGATGMLAAGASGPLIGHVYDRATIARLPPPLVQRVVLDGRLSPAARATLSSPADLAAMREAERQGAATTFRVIALLPVLPLFVYLGLWFHHRRRGGWRAVRL